MTPKEKAEDLVSKYKYPDEQSNGNIWAKQCAIICVEQILDAVTTIADKKYDYYKEVLNILKGS